ncbi:hypothetical protein ACLIIZ_17085 [Azonexus caeni]|jgi:hypothetical protein|uniref:hypothetical protein n=1 Tax=Azonexus caeni TaxID=266126 RepID=UPI003A8BF38E
MRALASSMCRRNATMQGEKRAGKLLHSPIRVWNISARRSAWRQVWASTAASLALTTESHFI